MGIKDKVAAFGKRFKLDSHHAVERSGLFFGVIGLVGIMVFAGSAVSATVNNNGEIATTSVWTSSFTTSKTQLQGTVDGVYSNKLGDQALVMMHFSDSAKISYNAKDYEAFLLGSNANLGTEKVSTGGVKAEFTVFGSTGYMGVLLTADQPFDQQVLNLTMRANAELSFKDQSADGASTEEMAGDETFGKYDQWRVYVNPGAKGTKQIDALDAASFDPAKAYYEIVSQAKEKTARTALDSKLLEMRTYLTQIDSYTADLATTKVDGLFLRPPPIPTYVEGDEVKGESKAEAKDGKSTLDLVTKTSVPGGFNFNWRAGNVYDGYLDALVPDGESYVKYLQAKAAESSSSADPSAAESSSGSSTPAEVPVEVSDMEWVLSDGSNLTEDYRSSNSTMRPLINVMNNLSQAYQDYYAAKQDYQGSLTLDLLQLDVDLRDVQSNKTTNAKDFLVVYQ